MGEYDAAKRLSKKEIDELFIDFVKAMDSVRNSVEASNFIKDLLTEQELIILVRRLQVVRLLEQNYTYKQIHKVMRVGNSTVTKVHAWMDLYGEGYRTVIGRTKNQSETKEVNTNSLSWAKHKRKYPMHYWPELLLKEIIKSANQKEKRKLLAAVESMKEKTKLNKEIVKLLQPIRPHSISHTPAYGR